MTLQFSRATLEQYLATLCSELGAPPIALNDDGEAHVAGQYEDREVTVSIVLREPLQMLSMRAPVVLLASPDMAASAQALLLGLNLSPGDLLGTAFALSPTDGTVYLVTSMIGPDFTYAGFRVSFLRLFALASIWRKQLSSSPAFHDVSSQGS